MEHILASKIATWCMKRNEMSETQAIAVTYGIELIFNSLFKLLGLLLLGIIFDRAREVILSVACFSLLRSQAGGVHMKTSIGCFLSMLLVCICACAGAELIESLPIAVFIIIAVGNIVLNKLFAPFFTENNPILDERIIRKKNTGAVVLSMVFFVVAGFVPVWKIKLLILIPVTIETLSILPCWHKRRKKE